MADGGASVMTVVSSEAVNDTSVDGRYICVDGALERGDGYTSCGWGCVGCGGHPSVEDTTVVDTVVVEENLDYPPLTNLYLFSLFP